LRREGLGTTWTQALGRQLAGELAAACWPG
jgi:hypothetical protein